MLKNPLVYILFLLLMVNCSTAAKENNWSLSQGKKNWAEANLQCSRMGMKLPTIHELEIARRKGLPLNWGVGGDIYWSSTLVGKDEAQTLIVGAPILLIDSDKKYRKHNFLCLAL